MFCYKEKFILPSNKRKINFKVIMTLSKEKQKYYDNNKLCGELLTSMIFPPPLIGIFALISIVGKIN